MKRSAEPTPTVTLSAANVGGGGGLPVVAGFHRPAPPFCGQNNADDKNNRTLFLSCSERETAGFFPPTRQYVRRLGRWLVERIYVILKNSCPFSKPKTDNAQRTFLAHTTISRTFLPPPSTHIKNFNIFFCAII